MEFLQDFTGDWDMGHNTIHNTRSLSLIPDFHDKMSLKTRARKKTQFNPDIIYKTDIPTMQRK